MPVEHFKSKEAYRKNMAYRHIHNIPFTASKVVVGGKAHEVQHTKGGIRAKIDAAQKQKSVGHYVEKDGKEHSRLPRHSEARAEPHYAHHVHHAEYYDGREDGHGSSTRRDGVMYRDAKPDGKRAR